MAGNSVNGGGNGARSGAQALTLLAAPLNGRLLGVLAAGPRLQADLRTEVGMPAQSTLRTQLKRLDGAGAVERRRRNGFPGAVECELTAAGHDLLYVLTVLQRWLSRAPQGPLAVDSNEAKTAVTALVEGWSTSMLRALAVSPLSLTELNRVIGCLSYPALERRLAAMRLVGLVKATPGGGRGTPYMATEWLRQGVAPLTAACWWERRHRPRAAPQIGRLDVETALLLTAPCLRLPAKLSGTCSFAVEVADGDRRPAGVVVEVKRGAVTSCGAQLDRDSDAWAQGSVDGWLAAVVERDLDRLELSGDRRLARALVDGLHRSLFREPIAHFSSTAP